MTEEHYIKWVALETSSGNQRKLLVPGSDPVVKFALLPGDEVVSCVAYCNLHGLWADK
jgi:superoxide reductase